MSDPDQMVREVEELKDVLLRNGFVRCDIAACNCGSWHARYGYPQRMEEIREAITDAGHPPCNDNGNLTINALRELIAELDLLRAAPAHPAQPVAFSVGRTLHWHKGQGITDAQLYAHPAGDAIRDAALEEAAQECDRQQREEPECPERAEYCAAAIRALRGRAG